MTLNPTEIMSAAWKGTREMMRMGYAAHQLREVFTYCLRRAWAAAKAAAALLARSAASLWAELQDMENRDRLGFQGIERLSQLRRAYHAAKAREDAEAEAQAQADIAEKRDLIQSAKGRFAAVTFTKKDGSTRVMRVQPAKLKYHVKGDAAAPSARKAVQTRKARDPHLMAVWEEEGPVGLVTAGREGYGVKEYRLLQRLILSLEAITATPAQPAIRNGCWSVSDF